MIRDSGIVGAYQAKTHFSQLLERVEAGEEITITRHGSPVARLVPVTGKSSAENRRDAIAQMRELAARNSLRGLRVKDLIAEGRK
ncbi:MAG TPA: type II toxin-antitoxin system prevent-host-death family antitoxin [Planctomycetaceae bacterium]|jgi:prevent-host-death family protein|nr:type II toxin-antitoxin system prevent-host-death family antitoxin [Planctomycetaceae bacterium]